MTMGKLLITLEKAMSEGENYMGLADQCRIAERTEAISKNKFIYMYI